ncbi:MAG: glycosyltransferase family protein [Planctomycetota bacterium]
MSYNIRIVSTFPPRRCGIGTFSRDLANALKDFKSDVHRVRIAAIDNGGLDYGKDVDIVIDQYNCESWQKSVRKITSSARRSTSRTIALLQHEYGLDPDEQGGNRGTNYVTMSRSLCEKGIITLVYLHTVLEKPDDHQKTTLQQLAEHSDGLIVTTESAIDILTSEAYSIRRSKIIHIDHGIRMHNPFQYDRLMIKEQFGLEDHFLVTTLGLRSPDKGIQYGVRGYGRFLAESSSESQRKKLIYLVAGKCHPEFVKADGGKHYRQYQQMMHEALESSDLRWCEVDELKGVDFDEYDVVFFDTFLDDNMLLKFYGATNVMLLPYLNMQQMSSGILADTMGSGRVSIATKFRYATELIDSSADQQRGIVLGKRARGILVDPAEPSVEQIAQGLDYLVFNMDERLGMERRSHRRGYQMRWDNTAWQLLQYVHFIREKREIVSGRGIEFNRDKQSIYEL